jgi:hypothetical protein
LTVWPLGGLEVNIGGQLQNDLTLSSSQIAATKGAPRPASPVPYQYILSARSMPMVRCSFSATYISIFSQVGRVSTFSKCHVFKYRGKYRILEVFIGLNRSKASYFSNVSFRHQTSIEPIYRTDKCFGHIRCLTINYKFFDF